MPSHENDEFIQTVRAREVLDSRGNPTVEAEVRTEHAFGRASVPSGKSKGMHEALELRDEEAGRFHGRGVLKAVENVNNVISSKLKGFGCAEQEKIDRTMIQLDGTKNKGVLGANATLAVSIAAAKAAAEWKGKSLFRYLRERSRYRMPVPMMNIINGGEHAGNKLTIQEFLVEPVGAESCSTAIRFGSEVYHTLGEILKDRYGKGAINVGDEGGFAPPMKDTREALGMLRKAIRKAGYGEDDVRLGIDAAASTFYMRKRMKYRLDGREVGKGELEDFYASLVDEFGLLTIEDPFEEEAFDDFASITGRLGGRALIVGDDIYVTSVERIRRGIERRATNCVLIKPNQVGTITETVRAMELAVQAGWRVVVSHRSGETEDAFISHLAVAYDASFLKAGAPARGERTAKYNELLRIEEELGSRSSYAGFTLGGRK